MGKHFERLPAKAMLDFLYAQQLQSPLILETGWLVIGHVDEFVQFLPFDNDLGFTIGIADTRSAMEVLKGLQTAGHGDKRAVNFEGEAGAQEPGAGMTINELLKNSTFSDANAYAQRHINANLEILLGEVPLARENIIHIPTLFRVVDFGGFGFAVSSDDGLPPHTPPVLEERQLAAFYPASINGIVIGTNYISPKPFGPAINGTDAMSKAVDAAYARAGMSVSYVDVYECHHFGFGDVHCGSNTLR